MAASTAVVNGVSGYVPTYPVSASEPFGASQDVRGIWYGGGNWVAVGSAGIIATASTPDGTWTSRTSNQTLEFRAVCYGNGVWVAVGLSGIISTATDPTGTWTARTALFGGENAVAVAYGNGVWVVGGGSSGGTLATATDPTGTWTTNTGVASIFGANSIVCLAYGGGVWVAAGTGGKLATATDPTSTWTERTSQFGSNAIRGLAYSGWLWAIAGDNGYVSTATDPTSTWTLRTSPSTDHTYYLAFGAGEWVFGGNNAPTVKPRWTSPDPRNSISLIATGSGTGYCAHYAAGVWGFGGSGAGNGEIASANYLVWTETGGGTVIEWFTPQLEAATLAGPIHFTAWAQAGSGTYWNATARIEIVLCNNDGSSPMVYGAATATWGITNATARPLAAWISGQSLSIAQGQRILVRALLDDFEGGVVTGIAYTLSYSEADAGIAGDMVVVFPVTLTQYTPPSGVRDTNLVIQQASFRAAFR